MLEAHESQQLEIYSESLRHNRPWHWHRHLNAIQNKIAQSTNSHLRCWQRAARTTRRNYSRQKHGHCLTTSFVKQATPLWLRWMAGPHHICHTAGTAVLKDFKCDEPRCKRPLCRLHFHCFSPVGKIPGFQCTANAPGAVGWRRPRKNFFFSANHTIRTMY